VYTTKPLDSSATPQNDKLYLKKLGLINFNIAHIVHNKAKAIATFVIFFFHSAGLHDAHCIPPTIIIINDTNIITVTNILDATLTIVGNALRAAVSFSHQPDFSKQFHKNGIEVFSGIHFFTYLQVQ
jgi:hypothetical protein